jgi:flagellar basal-body rod modification protein FlgD
MTPSTLPAIQPGATTGNAGSTAASSTNTNNAAQNRFLTLLVAQMQAQDPLNPMDNAQMTTQLAQISTVDGVEKLNVTMEKLLSQFGALEQLNATSLIGRNVLIPADRIDLSQDDTGTAVAAAGFELPQQASRVKIEIRDANGLPLRTIDMGAMKQGMHTFSWDGKTDAGVSVADGRYSFAMTAEANGSVLSVRSLSVAHVEGMRKTDNRTMLDLGAYGLRPQSDVLAVY